MNKYLIITFLLILYACGSDKIPNYKNSLLSFDERIQDLMQRMTIDEKISQISINSPAINHLNISQFSWKAFFSPVKSHYTFWPKPIALASMFDDRMMHRYADALATEIRMRCNTGEYTKENLLASLTNLNLFRDPRAGDAMETFGEDAFLISSYAKAIIEGFRGNHPKFYKALPGFFEFPIQNPFPFRKKIPNLQISDFDLFKKYLSAYRILQNDTNLLAIIYNNTILNNQQNFENDTISLHFLRNELNFDGLIVCPCQNSFENKSLIGNSYEASKLIKVGIDVNCSYTNEILKEAFLQKFITEEQINKILYRRLLVRFRLGEFEEKKLMPYNKLFEKTLPVSEFENLNLNLARKSIVLLKNSNRLLPLSKNTKTILVCGPNANNVSSLTGCMLPPNDTMKTPLKAIREKLPSAKILYSKGCDITDENNFNELPSKFFQGSLRRQVYNNVKLNGLPIDVSNENNIGFTFKKNDKIFGKFPNSNWACRYTGDFKVAQWGHYYFSITGTGGYRLFLNDKKIIDNWNDHQCETNYNKVILQPNLTYKLKLEYYNRNDDAHLQIKWSPAKTMSDIINPNQTTLDLANQSDVIVFFGGISPEFEGAKMPLPYLGFENGNRTTAVLPEIQSKLISSLLQTGKPLVLVLMNGGPISIPHENETVPAILEAWYPGSMGGLAIADIIFGDVSPTAHLPVTISKSDFELSPYENFSMALRTYKYSPFQPLYPFGYGLGYTTFEISELSAPEKANLNNILKVSVDLENNGKMAGEEVVQIYLKRIDKMPSDENIALIAYRSVHLNANEKMTIEFQINTKSPEKNIRPGKYYIYAANRVPLVKNQAGINVTDIQGKIIEITE